MMEDSLTLKRLRMRSWRRGMREMDLILGPYADEALAELDAADLAAYERLLAENDQDLYRWVTRAAAAPPGFGPVLARIRSFHRLD